MVNLKTRNWVVVATLILISLLAITFINVRQRNYRREIGRILNINDYPTDKEIIKAIPNAFDLGSNRDDVRIQIKRIYPDFNPEDSFHTLNGHGERKYDYIEFYRSHMYGAFFTFIYDENNSLIEIKHEPS